MSSALTCCVWEMKKWKENPIYVYRISMWNWIYVCCNNKALDTEENNKWQFN